MVGLWVSKLLWDKGQVGEYLSKPVVGFLRPPPGHNQTLPQHTDVAAETHLWMQLLTWCRASQYAEAAVGRTERRFLGRLASLLPASAFFGPKAALPSARARSCVDVDTVCR